MNDQGAFQCLLAEPPSRLESLSWHQPNGRFAPSNLRSLLSLSRLQHFLLDVVNVDHLISMLAVVSTCQQGQGRMQPASTVDGSERVFLRSFDFACAGEPAMNLVPAALTPADQAAVLWS